MNKQKLKINSISLRYMYREKRREKNDEKFQDLEMKISLVKYNLQNVAFTCNL